MGISNRYLAFHSFDRFVWLVRPEGSRRSSSPSDPQDLNNDEHIRTISTRFPPTTSGRVPSNFTQKSPLSPHRESLKFTYVTNMRQRTMSVATTALIDASPPSIGQVILEAPPAATPLGMTKQKASWPSPTTVSNNNNTVSNASGASPSDASSASAHENRRRKTSSSDSRSPRKENESQTGSFDLSDPSLAQSTNSSGSVHFIQRTLNQHASQAIAKGRLRHLGYMAANITDFDLVNWLKTHK